MLDLEFLITDPTSERSRSPTSRTCRRSAFPPPSAASIRRSTSAASSRSTSTSSRPALRAAPDARAWSCRNFWGSEAAKTDGSFNLAGISHPAVDALIDKISEAKSRDELKTATRALDRVLRAGHYWVPHWYKAAHHVVHWDKFGRPAVKPRYERGIIAHLVVRRRKGREAEDQLNEPT